jgi:succinoglycan biosynthesis protein ExoA
VAALLVTSMLLPIFTIAGYLLALIGGSYVFALVGGSILSARDDKWALLPLLPIAFAILHLAYGSGFLIGLFRFSNRWREGRNKLQPRAAIRDSEV